MNILITLLIILIAVAAFYLVLYLFEKLVKPIDPKVKGILIFILVAVLIIYALSGHSLAFWR